MSKWDSMPVEERIELALRCMVATLPHDAQDEAVKIAREGDKVYADLRHSGFEEAARKARVRVISEVLKSS